MKLKAFSTDFRKTLKYQISRKSAQRSRVVPCGRGRKDGRKDRHDEAKRRFSQFCEYALKTSNSDNTITTQKTDKLKIAFNNQVIYKKNKEVKKPIKAPA